MLMIGRVILVVLGVHKEPAIKLGPSRQMACLYGLLCSSENLLERNLASLSNTLVKKHLMLIKG